MVFSLLWNLEKNIGTLNIGADADIAIIDHIKDKKFKFRDAENNLREGKELLIPKVTLRKGERFSPKHGIHENLL